MSHNHGKMGSNRANETIIKRGSQGGAAVAGRGKLVAAVAAGMLSAPKKRPDRILRRLNCRCLLRIVTGKKVGPLNILTMIWKWPFQKMLSHSNPTNWIFYRRSSGPKNQWQNNVSFSVCVFLGAIICARSRTLDALALEPIGLDKTKRELWQSGHDNFHASNCRDKYSSTTAPQRKNAQGSWWLHQHEKSKHWPDSWKPSQQSGQF